MQQTPQGCGSVAAQDTCSSAPRQPLQHVLEQVRVCNLAKPVQNLAEVAGLSGDGTHKGEMSNI